MALNDWTVNESPGGLSLVINTTTPLVDSGSLRGDNTGFGGSVNYTNLTEDNYTKGIARGKIRTIMQAEITGNRWQAGINFVADNLDLTGGAAGTYIWCAESDAGLRTFKLYEYGNGFGSSATKTLHTVSSPAWTAASIFTLEVEWNLDIAGLGGCRIIARHGTATDFSDLVDVYDAVDGSPHVSTATAEGLFIRKYDTLGDNYDVQFDNTSIFTIA